MTPIRADLVAAKIKSTALSPDPRPRFNELLWFLQWVSFQPGGIEAMVKRLTELFQDRFQTRAMVAAGAPDKNGRYSLAQCLAIWKTETGTDPVLSALRRRAISEDSSVMPERSELERISYDEFLMWFVEGNTSENDAKGSSVEAEALRVALHRFNYEWLCKNCIKGALQNLPRRLLSICEDQTADSGRAWYCADLHGTLLAFMDHHAEEMRAQIADTCITKTVFRELEFAYSERAAVPVVGESRFGKTKAVGAFCQMYPGRARIVTVPESNRESDFIYAHCDAFGIDYTPGAPLSALKDKVEFILRHAGVLVVYDEAHFLVPISYHKTTPPRRLNWVRTKVIDHGVGCAFFATPQSYDQTLEKYVKTTGFRVEQWLGRLAPAVILSDIIPYDQIVEVARKNFPELSDAELGELADRAILSEGYLKNLDLAGRRARFIARERGHSKPTMKDVVDACQDMMPAAPRIVTETVSSKAHSSSLIPDRRKSSALITQPASNECVAGRHTAMQSTSRVIEPTIV